MESLGEPSGDYLNTQPKCCGINFLPWRQSVGRNGRLAKGG